jgi:hypothetical protein
MATFKALHEDQDFGARLYDVLIENGASAT